MDVAPKLFIVFSLIGVELFEFIGNFARNVFGNLLHLLIILQEAAGHIQGEYRGNRWRPLGAAETLG